VIHLKGDVALHVNGVLLTAQEVDYHWRTAQIEAREDVHIVASAGPVDLGTIRHGIK